MITAPTVTTDTDNEAALVGSLLLEPGNFPLISTMVSPTDFTDPVAKEVYSALLALHADGESIDLPPLKAHLQRQGRFAALGGPSAIAGLMDAPTSGANAEFYASEVSRQAKDRQRKEIISQAYVDVQSDVDPAAACKQLLESLERIAGDADKITILDAGKWLQEDMPAMPNVIEGLLDVGDKCFVIGGPKTRKSFFVMQLALSLATGSEFLGFHIPQPCRVAVCQMEIQPHHYHRRLSRLAAAKAIDFNTLQDQLFVANLRGINPSLDDIISALHRFRPQVVICDPLYKLYTAGHDENSAGDAAALLAQFDRLSKILGCALVVVHHDRKRTSGDTKGTDRGSGSSAVARDYDAALLLTQHATEADAMVLECIARNHAPRDPVTILWDIDRFVVANNIPATPETLLTRTKKAGQGPGTDAIIEAAKERIANAGGRILSIELQDYLQKRLGIGENKTRTAIQLLEARFGFYRRKEEARGPMFIYSPDRQLELANFPNSANSTE